jgi:hypothetical protein
LFRNVLGIKYPTLPLFEFLNHNLFHVHLYSSIDRLPLTVDLAEPESAGEVELLAIREVEYILFDRLVFYLTSRSHINHCPFIIIVSFTYSTLLSYRNPQAHYGGLTVHKRRLLRKMGTTSSDGNCRLAEKNTFSA